MEGCCLQSCPEAASVTIQLLSTHRGTLAIAKSARIPDVPFFVAYIIAVANIFASPGSPLQEAQVNMAITVISHSSCIDSCYD